MKNVPLPNAATWRQVVALLFFFFVPSVSGLLADEPKQVLVLHSYHNGLTWSDAISRAIAEEFRSCDIPVEIEYAYMDTKHVFSSAYEDQLFQFFKTRFGSHRFSAIISSDDRAFNFLRSHGEELFGAVPVVFCGVNYFEDRLLDGLPNFTGVTESYDILTTLNTALDLQEGAHRIIAICDQSVSAAANKKRLTEISSRLKRAVEVTVVDSLTMPEVQQYVSGLTPDDILLWLAFTSDATGRLFSFEESTRLISAYSKAPMYSLWDFNLGHGIVGGMLISGTMQGKRAAEYTIQILHGAAVGSLPVIKQSPNQFMFDYLQMKRYGIDPDQLPPGSTVINTPVTLYSRHREFFWPVLSTFSAMFIIIFTLLVTIISRRKAEQALVASRNRYQNVFNSTSVVLFDADFSRIKRAIDQWCAEHEERFDTALEKNPDLLLSLAGQLSIEDANPAAVALFQAGDRERLLEELPRIVAADQSQAFKEILVALSTNQRRYVRESSNRTLNGEEIDLIISLNFPRDPIDYRHVIVSIIDITDRKKSEKALRRSEDRFKTVFNQAASGMALIGLDGRYLRINAALGKMLGYTEEELLQRTWKDITHPDDIAASTAMAQTVLGGKNTQPMEKRYIHKAGHIVHVLLNLSVIYDDARSPLYLIAQFQDITQIKETQAALKERQERYRNVFEADLSGVYVAAPNGRLLMCNQVFARILGFENADAVIGTHMIDYYNNPEQRPMLLARLIQKQTIQQVELEMVRKDGAVIQCLLNASGRFNEQGDLIEILGYLMDVTQMKSLEAQLLHAQKMESIGTMAGGVAHDFNNLLMGIMGYTSLLLSQSNEKHPQYHRLKNIEALVQSGADLTRQLLGFAKGGKYEVRTTDLNKLISRSAAIFARTTKEVQVFTDLAQNLWLVEADRSQLDQVLFNLYLNARQAMEDGGRIQIRTSNYVMDEASAGLYGISPGNYVEIRVTDNGRGMDAATQQRIFDPFFTTKERGRGTGLGLASAYGIIKNHGGVISVKSAPRTGTRFSILLPASKSRHVDTPPKPIERPTGGTETILLVDDEEGVLDAVGSMLRHLGYQVITAPGGKQAVDIFTRKHSSIDLVVLDLIMPDIGGKEAFNALKAIDPHVKVLLSSGYSADGQPGEIIKSGCLGFIQKPFTMSQLSRKLNEALKREAETEKAGN